MFPGIELVWLSETAPTVHWARGPVSRSAPTPWAVARLLERRLVASAADGFLFWDPALGAPDPVLIASLFRSRGDVWHAGLRLGMRGKPELLDFVAPECPLNRDPGADIEATSWRLSLRACLVRTEVLRALGGPDSKFGSLEIAGLEMGHRYIRMGAIPRHVPSLIGAGVEARKPSVSLADQLRFVSLAHGRFWARWALARAWMTGEVPTRDVIRCGHILLRLPQPPRVEPLKPRRRDVCPPLSAWSVSVILPTLDRYPYLFRLLAQLRGQTAPAGEIIVVDQTPRQQREPIRACCKDLPIRVLVRDEPGQCSARNEAIAAARGEFLLFLDDDDEIPPDLIESHLRCLIETRADGCCGAADEVGGDSVPPHFSHSRASDVFPTNNAMLRRTALAKSGLFDLAYERGELEDGDLGMRLLQSGAVLVLNPAVRVLHHHAPRGGLRAHGARVVTYAMSRNSLWARRLPAASEIYYLNRYFSPRQVREVLWLLVCGTCSVRGSVWKKAVKAVIASLQAPSTLLRIRAARKRAEAMTQSFPEIPALPVQLESGRETEPQPTDEIARAISA